MESIEKSSSGPADTTFSEKETKYLVAAMLSLKSGPPDVDMTKFTKAGGFNTSKTASNTWGTLKKKLRELNPVAEGDECRHYSSLSSFLIGHVLTSKQLQPRPRQLRAPQSGSGS